MGVVLVGGTANLKTGRRRWGDEGERIKGGEVKGVSHRWQNYLKKWQPDKDYKVFGHGVRGRGTKQKTGQETLRKSRGTEK